MEKDAQAGEPEEEEVDDELSSTDLYEDSMAEVTLNETRGGHDSDPFDRSGEYDEDVDLAAPPPITPDIPEIPADVLISLKNRAEGTAIDLKNLKNPFDDSQKVDESEVEAPLK
ncbi:Intraflagellar transport protein 46 homolog [Caenorhabditis elegans]|uniref:Intraflagellar transport protein 46 homolog n=1 Tax=Caenorhabditis elegans TaxID=6239 RepID=Q21822_CAEEL|nr:Intraflagellar transport protein 46 homolog [Caenorhabditis elegans]CAA83618.1 Intraflagellar transport protein 46 homolog [Caenorhabditis elegans]|eukprot:NP_497895.1 Uncharacterized protein CELE_R07E5.11 [Caenorhabditis elegans]